MENAGKVDEGNSDVLGTLDAHQGAPLVFCNPVKDTFGGIVWVVVEMEDQGIWGRQFHAGFRIEIICHTDKLVSLPPVVKLAQLTKSDAQKQEGCLCDALGSYLMRPPSCICNG